MRVRKTNAVASLIILLNCSVRYSCFAAGVHWVAAVFLFLFCVHNACFWRLAALIPTIIVGYSIRRRSLETFFLVGVEPGTPNLFWRTRKEGDNSLLSTWKTRQFLWDKPFVFKTHFHNSLYTMRVSWFKLLLPLFPLNPIC